MELFMEWLPACAIFPNDRWRGLSGRSDGAQQQKGKWKWAVSNSCCESLDRRGLRKRQGGGDEGGPQCGLAAPGRWIEERAACWVNTLAGCDRCAGHRRLSSQQLQGRPWWAVRTLNARRRFPVFPLCFAWRTPNRVASAKNLGLKGFIYLCPARQTAGRA